MMRIGMVSMDNYHRLLAVYGRALQDLEHKLDAMRDSEQVNGPTWLALTRQFEGLVTGLIDLAGHCAEQEAHDEL